MTQTPSFGVVTDAAHRQAVGIDHDRDSEVTVVLRRVICNSWRRLGEDTGATMPEYALMVGFIAAVAFAGAEVIGVNVLNKLSDFAASF